jgi:TRAP-type C4-dicarboxylate transport system substrate-binding protein
MMKRKSIILIVLSVVLLIFNYTAYAGKKIVKLGHVNSPKSIFQFQALEFKKAVEAELPDFEIQVYPAGQLGGTDAMIQGLQLNSVQIYPEFPTLWGDIVSEFSVFAVHFLFDSMEAREAFVKSDAMVFRNTLFGCCSIGYISTLCDFFAQFNL